jgi:penicillin amidase/acyl-homoserine-lactone acylase
VVVTAAALAVLVAVLGVTTLVLWWREPSLPEGLVPEPGQLDVRILRDTWGVPHVFGRTDADVAHGLAWAHAEDDFPTIQGALLAARGKLASEFGRDAAPNDYMVQLLRIPEVVAAGYPTLSPETRALCEGYAAGLNHYAALHPEEAIARLYPVTGSDVVAGFVHKLPLFFGIDRTLGELLEEEPAQTVSDPPSSESTPSAPGTSARLVRGDLGPVKGSNAFAVAPSRTADGSTFLVVNSHQPWEGPVAWYEAHLRSDEGWEAVGGVFPGAPVILHGHNRRLGWAHTVNRPDLVDVYALETDPEQPGRYRFDGEWRSLERRRAKLEVKLWGPWRIWVEREVLFSVHGPALETPHGTYAIRFAGFGETRHVEQWYRMNRAQNLDQWRRAMALGAIPMFHTVYADAEGHVGYVYNAALPRRAEGWDWRRYLPGDRSETLWTELLPWEQLPQVFDPPSGFVQSCNSSPFRTTVGEGNPDPAEWSEVFGIERRMTNRALRALELFGADESIEWQELEAIKFDTAYAPGSPLLRMVERALALEGAGLEGAGLGEDGGELLARARDHLRLFDGEADLDDPHVALPVLAFGRFVDEEPPTDDDLLAALGEAVVHLDEHFGGLEVPWSEINRLRRGTTDLPLAGAPDVLHAVYGRLDDDGRLRGWAGDSYVLLAAWDGEGRVRSRSLHQYGSATLDPTSPHHADQAPLFARRQTKPVWLDEAEIRRHLSEEYRPGER